MSKGKVYLVGAGPGDPDLLTIRARDLLQRADVVVTDHLVPPFETSARVIDAGKRGRQPSARQEKIHRILVREARAGRTVVRLKGGDPFIFGRGGEEAEELRRAGIDFEVVPGVTAALGAAAYAGIPLTHRDCSRSVTFLTGHATDGLDRRGTLVFYMSVFTLREILAELKKRGWPGSTPVAIVQSATTPRQRVVTGTIDTIGRETVEPPAITIVGEVARHRVEWLEKRPLFGRRIIVTRARDQAGELVHRLELLGAEVILAPTIEIRHVPNPKIPQADFVIFTSANGVDGYFRHVKDTRTLAKSTIAAVGPATAASLERRGIMPDVVASEFTSEFLAKTLAPRVRGRTVLHAGADKTNPRVREILQEAGAKFRKVTLYRIVRARRPEIRDADLVTFASAETARTFASMTKLRPPAICIGPVTAKSAKAAGFRVVGVAREYTIDGLIEAILKWSK